jgi:hypothetical protein
MSAESDCTEFVPSEQADLMPGHGSVAAAAANGAAAAWNACRLSEQVNDRQQRDFVGDASGAGQGTQRDLAGRACRAASRSSSRTSLAIRAPPVACGEGGPASGGHRGQAE